GLGEGDVRVPGQRLDDIGVADLVDVERGDLAGRRIALADDAVAFHEAGDDVVGMTVAMIRRDNSSHLLVRGRRRDELAPTDLWQKRGRREAGSLSKKLTTRVRRVHHEGRSSGGSWWVRTRLSQHGSPRQLPLVV